jgi:hypothetical protein
LDPFESRESQLELLDRAAPWVPLHVRPLPQDAVRRLNVIAAIVTVRPHSHAADSSAERAVHGEKPAAAMSHAQYGHGT